MVASAVVPPVDPSVMESVRRDLMDETLVLALPGIVLTGFLLLATVSHFPQLLQGMVPGLLLWALAPVVCFARRHNYRVAAVTLVAGCFLAESLVVGWGSLGGAIGLLALPVGLSALLLGMPCGVLTAAICSLWLGYAPATLVPAGSELRALAAIGVWGTIGLIWLTTRPLLTTLQWSWSSYEQARGALDRARDTQMQLKQTVADLADANLQLSRLNRLAQSLRQAAEDARRAKEQFVANVSHELRTPLNMIVGFSRMIVEAPGTYPGTMSTALLADLEIIRRNALQLSRLIDDVLDLSQIEAGRMALSRERASLREVIDDAVVAVRPLYRSKNLTLEAEMPADLPAVYCDPTRVREVVLNLLSNAGRFTELGGVCLRAWREEGDVVVSVADTGPGIDPRDQDLLFRPFEQLDGTIGRRHGGTGLGLAISKSFVELHGGRMWLESKRGAGTTFYFRLPVDPPAPLEEPAARWLRPDWAFEERTHPPLARPPEVRPRLVVLEAGDTLRRLLGRYLDGVEIVPAATLEQAGQELARTPAQALLVNDPSVTGALEQLTASGVLPYGTPAILCSIPGLHEAAGALGISEYLVKPVGRDALVAALERLRLPRRTVLVVDDEPEAQRLFWRMLASGEPSYRVLTASNGREALDMLREVRPDALLLDLLMPEMDGFQLLAAKNADPALRDIPVVVISAQDPAGQAIVTNAVAITRGGGLAMSHVLNASN